MNTLNVVSVVVSMLCVIIMCVLAWVTIYRVQKTEVSFSGTPTDIEDFDAHCVQNRLEHADLYGKFNALNAGVSKLQGESEGHTATLLRLDNKMDRMLEKGAHVR